MSLLSRPHTSRPAKPLARRSAFKGAGYLAADSLVAFSTLISWFSPAVDNRGGDRLAERIATALDLTERDLRN